MEATPPSTVEVELWNISFNSELNVQVLLVLRDRQSVGDGLTAVAALQRSRAVQDFH